MEILTWLQIVTGGHRCFSICCNVWSPYPLSQFLTWFHLGVDFLKLLLGGNMNMAEIVTGGHMCFTTRFNVASLIDDFTY